MPIPNQPSPPALKRLDILVGTWIIRGRTLDSQEGNIRGTVSIEWLPGGYFLQQRGEMDLSGFKVHSLEIVGFDASSGAFSSSAYTDLGGEPASYHWDVQGNLLTHWDSQAKFTGRFSEDGNTLTGGWRPEKGKEGSNNLPYDATLIWIK